MPEGQEQFLEQLSCVHINGSVTAEHCNSATALPRTLGMVTDAVSIPSFSGQGELVGEA